MCEGGFLNGQLGVSRGIGDYHLEPRVKQKPSATAPLQGPLTAGILCCPNTKKNWEVFVYLKYWTLILRPLLVCPDVLFPPGTALLS